MGLGSAPREGIVVAREYVPEAGDLVWVDFTPQAGHEQAGRRPAVVLTPRAYNGKTSLAVMSPITSRRKGHPFEVPLPPSSRIQGAILVDHLKSLDWRARRAQRVGRLPPAALEEVWLRISLLLQIA